MSKHKDPKTLAGYYQESGAAAAAPSLAIAASGNAAYNSSYSSNDGNNASAVAFFEEKDSFERDNINLIRREVHEENPPSEPNKRSKLKSGSTIIFNF
jgi:hypothetical protein